MKWLDKISSIFSPLKKSDKTQQNQQQIVGNNLIITPTELKSIASKIAIPNDNYNKPDVSSMLTQLFAETSENISGRIMDARRIKKIATDLQHAEEVLIASILSPNNFFQYQCSFVLPIKELNDSYKSKILDLVKNCAKQLKIQDSLREWIKQIVGVSGSKPILVLPFSIIQSLRADNILSINMSTEELSSKINELDSNRIYESGYTNSKLKISTEQLNDSGSVVQDMLNDYSFKLKLNTSLEELFTSMESETSGNSSKKSNNSNVTITDNNPNNITKKLSEYFKNTDIDNKIVFTEDPRIIVVNKEYKDLKKKSIDQTLNSFLRNDNHTRVNYKDQPFMNILNYFNGKEDKDGIPLIIELPSESVIPLSSLGSSNKHIGYFVLLDEFGEPLSSFADKVDDLMDVKSPKEDKLIQNLYQVSFSRSLGNTLSSFSRQGLFYKSYHKLIGLIYGQYIDKYLYSNLNKIGFTSINFKITEDIIRLLAYRILEKKKTRILFVPESLLVYSAYEYDEHGVGISKVEEIKFITTLRIVCLITSLFSMMENAVNTKDIKVSFDDGVANPLQLAKEIKRSMINSHIFNFSYEPSNIIKTLLEKEVSITPSNIPGIGNFEVTTESKQRNNNTPDSSLMEKLDNLSGFGYGIPPSLLNQLNETEYSRTVASNNLIFSMKILNYQKITIKHMNKLIQLVIRYYPSLRNSIRDVIRESVSANSDIEDKDIEDYVNKTLELVINNISFTLPSPKMTHDKAIFNEISDFENAINSLVDMLFPSDLIGSDLSESYATYKALVKSKLTRSLFNSANIFQEFNIKEAEEISIDDIDLKSKLFNLDKLLKDLNRVIKPE